MLVDGWQDAWAARARSTSDEESVRFPRLSKETAAAFCLGRRVSGETSASQWVRPGYGMKRSICIRTCSGACLFRVPMTTTRDPVLLPLILFSQHCLLGEMVPKLRKASSDASCVS